MNPNELRYTAVAIVLHWAIAAAILSNLALYCSPLQRLHVLSVCQCDPPREWNLSADLLPSLAAGTPIEHNNVCHRAFLYPFLSG